MFILYKDCVLHSNSFKALKQRLNYVMIFIYIYRYGIISVLNKYNVNLNFVFHFPIDSGRYNIRA